MEKYEEFRAEIVKQLDLNEMLNVLGGDGNSNGLPSVTPPPPPPPPDPGNGG